MDIRGLGIFDAIAAVCNAAGFEFSLMPHVGEADEAIDRPYVFRLWRRNAGPLKQFLLPKRGDFSGNAADDLQHADVSKLQIMRDAAHTITEVNAFAPTFIEASFPLKPLWKPGDVDDTEPDATFQQKGDSPYHQKHVVGGLQFTTYGHVGRLWGLDCTGEFAADGYQEEPYKHDPDGFDFLAFLGIDGSDKITEERTDLGLTAPIKWNRKRLRHALPLRRPDAKRKGIRYVLEVTEDVTAATPTWTPISTEFRSLAGFFGVDLTGGEVGNLAAVNLSNVGDRAASIPVEESWWQLLRDEKLGFRLTCAINCDHAAQYNATRQPTAGSAYRRSEVIQADIEEYWVAPGSHFATGGEFVKIGGWGIVNRDGQYITNVREAAERRRDAMEGLRVAGAAQTFLMDLNRWQVGDRIGSIHGRDFSLASNAGNAARHPTVAAMTVQLSPGPTQGLVLQLHDEAFGAR